MKTTEYRVVWQDRYHHASASTESLEAAESFTRMLTGTACTSAIQRREKGQAAWRELGRLFADLVDERRGPIELTGDVVAGSDAKAHADAQEQVRLHLRGIPSA